MKTWNELRNNLSVQTCPRCQWYEGCPEEQTDEQEMKMICPICGESTKYERIRDIRESM